MLSRWRRKAVRRLSASATGTMNFAVLATMSALAYSLGAAGQDEPLKVGGEIGVVVFVAVAIAVRVRTLLLARTRQ